MLYDVGFLVYREDEQPIPVEVINRLTDAWVAAVEKEGLWTGGGISPYTRFDDISVSVHLFLWRFKFLRHWLNQPSEALDG